MQPGDASAGGKAKPKDPNAKPAQASSKPAAAPAQPGAQQPAAAPAQNPADQKPETHASNGQPASGPATRPIADNAAAANEANPAANQEERVLLANPWMDAAYYSSYRRI